MPGPVSDEESVFGPWDALEGTLGAAREREELLSGFAPGGVWDKHPPGPELAAALARAAGPQWRCAGATGEELVGLLRGMARQQSWSGAGLLGVVRALIRDDDLEYLGRPRHGSLPDVWDDSLVAEIALALAVSAPSADRTTRAAWELAARLPGVELLLRDGTLDLPRARLVAEVFGELSDENCARAEELLLPELTAAPRKTYTQVERIATAIAAAVDPELAERRRKAAERHSSRVAMFREPSGAAGLSGRDLPVDETLAAYANLDARARRYKDSGAFPGERIDRLRAAAYLDILNGVAAGDRIACGHLGSDPDDSPVPAPPRGRPGDAPDDAAPAGRGGPGRGGPADGPGASAGRPGGPVRARTPRARPARAGPIAPATSATAAARPPATTAIPATNRTTTSPATTDLTTATSPTTTNRTTKAATTAAPAPAGPAATARAAAPATRACKAAAPPAAAAETDPVTATSMTRPATAPEGPRRHRDRRSSSRPAAPRRR